MKRINSSSLSIAVLLILIGSMALLYWFGFYKQFDKQSIPADADGIAIADIKNIRNHFVFSYLKNPSQWGFSPSDAGNKKRFDISDYGIETPDYLAFFHIENQPLNQWCFTAAIENESKFSESLLDNRFVKIQSGKLFISYYSKTIDACIVKYANKILYCTNASKSLQVCIRTAENLFAKNLYFDSKKIEKAIVTNNAVTFWIKKNYLLDQDAILNLALQENGITAEGHIKFKSSYRKMASYTQNPNALFSLGFNFEMIQKLHFLNQNKSKINKILGFSMDSILKHRPAQTELILHNIIEKQDSAITYDYDDDFNPIKKVIVHKSREPSFHFSIQTANSKKAYDYLRKQNVIDDHQLFLNFPLAKTKAFIRENALTLEANPINKSNLKASAPKIGYLQIHFSKLQPKDWRYILAKNKNIEFLKSFERIEINLNQKTELVSFEAFLEIKKDKNWIEIIE